MKPSYKQFPFITRGRVIMALILYAIFMAFPLYLGLNTQSPDSAQAADLALFFTLVFIEYFVFFLIPYIFYLRASGRFLYIPARYAVNRMHFQPFSPFGDEPLKYGAKPYGPLFSFFISLILLAGFVLVLLFPTVYFLFGTK